MVSQDMFLILFNNFRVIYFTFERKNKESSILRLNLKIIAKSDI